jgi:hypothetical protein
MSRLWRTSDTPGRRRSLALVPLELKQLDLRESDERDRGAFFAALKAHPVAYMLETPGRAALIVDEAER